MTQRDFSKPIGWWCPACGTTCEREEQPAPIPCFVSGRVEALIPVFAEIPEGDRPATHEPDDDTVVRFCGAISNYVALGAVAADEAPEAVRRWASLDDCFRGDDHVAPCQSLADAVSWVAEGRLP